MQDFAPFTPELMEALSGPPTPDRTATALCAVGQPALRVEGPTVKLMLWRATRLRNLGALLATY
jgi:hypothetical protein